MEWIAHCTVCGEISRGPNGQWEEAEARVHRKKTGHTTIVGYEPSIVMSDEMVEVELGVQPEYISPGRPFPRTYDEWWRLGEDIKRVRPDLTLTVNDQLNNIMYQTEGVEASKRWLAETTGELGIK